jgi:hypothetical protein
MTWNTFGNTKVQKSEIPLPCPFLFMRETETEISGFYFFWEKRQEIGVNQRLIDS